MYRKRDFSHSEFTFHHHDHLEEAKEEGVDSNGVDGEAGGGDDVGADHDQQDRDEAEVQLVLLPGDGHAEEEGGQADDKDLAEQDDKVGHLVDEEAAEDVGGDQGEGVLRGLAEVRAHHGRHDVGIPVEISDQLLQEEEACSKKPDDPLDQLVLRRDVVDPVIYIFHCHSHQLDQGEEQGAKSHRSKVVSEGPLDTGAKHVVGQFSLVEGPVPGGDSSCQHQVSGGRDEGSGPQGSKEVVPLKNEVEGATSVPIEDASRLRTV